MNKTTFMAKPGQVERNGTLLTQLMYLLDAFQQLLLAYFAEKTNQHSHLTLIQVTS